MKTRNKFIIGIVLLLGIMVLIEYRMPRQFVWVPTYSHTDAQPFGCMLFDSVMKASMPHGYTVKKKTVLQMYEDSLLEHPRTYADSVSTSPKSVLIITNEALAEYQRDDLLLLASEGHTVMLATTMLNIWEDTLNTSWEWNHSFKLNEIARKQVEKGKLHWVGRDSSYAKHKMVIPVYDQIVERTLETPDSIAHEVLLTYQSSSPDSKEVPVAISYPIGEGELIIVSAPLLLTNYSIISGDGWVMVGRLMDRLKKNPVIRSESYMSATATSESSPFYVFLQQPPLRWTLYLSVLSVIAFCLLTARRRQRAIPVTQKPQNKNLEFVQLIGSLYWQQHDNAGLLAKKVAYATEEIRRQNAQLTAEDLLTLNTISEYASGGYVINDQELKNYINEINRILQSI